MADDGLKAPGSPEAAYRTLLELLLAGSDIPEDLLNLPLPCPPPAACLKAFGRSVRVQNVLSRAGLLADPEQLARLTVAKALRLKGFGKRCLIDCLTFAADPDAARLLEEEHAASASQALKSSVRLSARELLQLVREPIPLSGLCKRMPVVPSGFSVDSANLRNRTRNALCKSGLDRELVRLEGMTVGEVLQVPGFGYKSLIDLLSAFADAERRPKPPPMPALVERLKQLAEQEPKVLTVQQTDPRFGGLLRSLNVASIEQLMERAALPLFYDVDAACLHTLIRRLVRAQKRSVTREFLEVLGYRKQPRRLAVVRAYFGLDQQGPRTLADVGRSFSVSRERVRQICTPPTLRGARGNFYLPRLDRAFDIIRKSAPCLATTTKRRLRRAGLLEEGTTLRSLLRIGRAFDREQAFVIRKLGRDVVLLPRQDAAMTAVLSASRRVLARDGAFTAERIAIVGKCARKGIDAEEAQALLKLTGYFDTVGEDSRWFVTKQGRDLRIHRRIARLLSVSGDLLLEQVRTALRRDYLRGRHVPPLDVFAEVAARSSLFDIENRRIRLAVADEARAVASPNDESTAVEVLKEMGGYASRRALQRALADRGIGTASFWRILNYSPFITRLGQGVYGLIGCAPSFGAVQELTEMKVGEGGIIDHGWLPDRRLWLAYRLSDAAIETGVIGIPRATANVMSNEYSVVTSTGPTDARLRRRNCSAWGLRRVLVELGAEAGDYLVLKLNVSMHVAELAVGDESVVDEVMDREWEA